MRFSRRIVSFERAVHSRFALLLLGASLLLAFSLESASAIENRTSSARKAIVTKKHIPQKRAHSVTLPKSSSIAPKEKVTSTAAFVPNLSDPLKGWQHIYGLLVQNGVDREYLREVIADPRMPAAETLYFSLRPREPKTLYSVHNLKRSRDAAYSCYQRYEELFEAASVRFKVPAGVIASILQVETGCGRNTGQSPAFYRLARLASAGDPATIEKNFEQKVSADRTVTREQVSERAKWLENTFFPHVLGALVVAVQRGQHPHELLGSGSGAIGAPQFLPGFYYTYGVDGDADEELDLFSVPDSIFSVANYLKQHGWDKPEMSWSDKEQVIWHYNHSEPYIETVLAMADHVELRRSSSLARSEPPATFFRIIPAKYTVSR